jgi:hypothetical protein
MTHLLCHLVLRFLVCRLHKKISSDKDLAELAMIRQEYFQGLENRAARAILVWR